MRAFTIQVCLAVLAHAPVRAQTPSFPSEEELRGKMAGELVTKLRKYGGTDANSRTSVGLLRTIFRTTNGGATWTSQVSGTTLHLNDVFRRTALVLRNFTLPT